MQSSPPLTLFLPRPDALRVSARRRFLSISIQPPAIFRQQLLKHFLKTNVKLQGNTLFFGNRKVQRRRLPLQTASACVSAQLSRFICSVCAARWKRSTRFPNNTNYTSLKMQPRQLGPSTALANKPQRQERWAKPVTLAFTRQKTSALPATRE